MQGQFTARQSRRRGGGPPGTSSSSATYKERVVEGAGRATADCAAVWCCCPCGVANLILFAVYRVPAGICRRAIGRRRKGRETLGKGGGRECEEDGGGISMLGNLVEMKEGYADGNEEVRLLDEEMLKKFYETGFWRSPSRMFS
ncbi:hypothetical protein MLD38_020287 [Melastoma candidum]|uniref:Uncharacterized protein n=1 Tax=Melastoma candidum TaxID=119954 RepID=A0ACB9QBX5_9MYRT|nr:hypothetical protein MLD38_020287 [Melastoma candidum]